MKLLPLPNSIRLEAYRFAAKIDYITIHTPGKVKLPALDGKPIWPRKHHGRRLTVHDATAADIDALIATFGAARLIELEIAIDLRPAGWVPAPECEVRLKAVMVDLFARGLEPSAGEGMSNTFRVFYRRLEAGYMVRPFNLGLPRPTDQQLHGGRNDAAQVKGYLKRRDQGKVLPPEKQVARVEVRLGSEGLFGHDLVTLTDIKGFRFRKKLMPYFRHVGGTARPRRRRKANAPVTMLDVLYAKAHQYDQEQFDRTGVGAFLRGGKRAGQGARLLRDIPVNNRLGQALTRLEQRFGKTKFVRPARLIFDENPGRERLYGDPGQSRMTNQVTPHHPRANQAQ